MTAEEAQEVADRLLLAFDLFDFGVKMMRQNLKRQHPKHSEKEIGLLLEQWLRKRDCAPLGDSPGIPKPIMDPGK